MQTRHDALPCGVSTLLLNPDRRNKASTGRVPRTTEETIKRSGVERGRLIEQRRPPSDLSHLRPLEASSSLSFN
jgi:hypothetical protein